MTTNERFERTMSAWLQDDAAFRVADHLDEVLSVTRETRQRPAWSSLERWLPVDTTFRPRSFTVPSGTRVIALAALLLLLLAIAIVAVGSRQRLPEPFGIARNGAMVGSRDGDIYRFDPATGQATPLITGPAFDFGPGFSRDGTKFAFLRSDGRPPAAGPAVLTMMVANADGSDLRAVTPPTRALDWLEWSPDSAHLAYIADGSLRVVDTATGTSTVLKTGQRAHMAEWLPPRGDEIIFRGETSVPGIFAIHPDGSGLRELSTEPPINRFDYGSLAVSPDGSRVAFTRWSNSGIPRVHAIDVATGQEILYPTSAAVTHESAFSPDGRSITYVSETSSRDVQITIAEADGSGNERGIGPIVAPTAEGAVPAFWVFTPDGKAVVARFGTDEGGTTYLIPIDGSDARVLDSGDFAFIDVQRLAP